VLNQSPGTFANYGIGDIVSFLSHSFGFNGIDATVRIMEREYRPEQSDCYLVVKEIN